jgi:glycine/D-amino acid oxidase-like deaminating enzyme
MLFGGAIGATAAVVAPGIAGLALAPTGVETNFDRGKSLWRSEVPELPKFPQIDGDINADLVVVGAGYTGLSCAYYVKKLRPDWRVVVVDSHSVGSGASSRNTGAVYARHIGISDHGLAERGLSRFRKFVDDEGIDCDFAPATTLMMLSSNGASELAPGEKLVSAAELQERTGSSYYAGAIDAPNYFTIHPAKLVDGHARAAMRLGVEIFEYSPVTKIVEGQPATLETPTGTLHASNVLIATNAYTPRLGLYGYTMFPVHQYSLATRQLSSLEIQQLGLDRWPLRFERNVLPVTYSLTPSGHFFARMVLGYASYDSSEWSDLDGAKKLATKLFEQRYPRISEFGPMYGWHGVTGHTVASRSIVGAFGGGNLHISAAYNGLGIMPSHNSGYLTANKIVGVEDDDYKNLSGASSHIPLPGDFYRSLIFKPFMNLMTPV